MPPNSNETASDQLMVTLKKKREIAPYGTDILKNVMVNRAVGNLLIPNYHVKKASQNSFDQSSCSERHPKPTISDDNQTQKAAKPPSTAAFCNEYLSTKKMVEIDEDEKIELLNETAEKLLTSSGPQ